MDTASLKTSLIEFAKWTQTYCQGYEKGEGQIFLNEFFKAFGYEGAKEAGAHFEEPLRKASQKGKTGFADCIFKDRVLIEIKKKDTNLIHHYNQLETYWTKCTPKPKYAVLCNFDEFWIHDFNIQVDDPIQKLKIEGLSEHPEALLFMLGKESRFNHNVIEITQTAVGKVAEVYRSLIYGQRKKSAQITDDNARRFILQCVFCMFAEDIGLLPDSFFSEVLEDCLKEPARSYDLILSLFNQMNSPKRAKGGRFKEVEYFNGGLFSEINPIELREWEIERLLEASNQNWKAVKPSIFGTILEATMDSNERHAWGVHYTSDIDIYKVITPTIIRYWDEKIEKAGKSKKKLKALLSELRVYKVLDPACGSGNFLYIAYQEIKRIEKEIVERIGEQSSLSLVTPMNFYGIDIKPFAVELAKLTLEIGRKMAIDKWELVDENPLPLNNLNNNIMCRDALFTRWPDADAIIGNPPFLGEKRMRTELGDEYVEKARAKFDETPQNIDFCAYWYRKAHDTRAERVGLVATNSISQGQSRKASLQYITENGGVIYDAVSTQPWSGEANVHVSIVNWAREPQQKYFIDEKPVSFINSSLKSEFDVTGAARLQKSKNICFQGVIPVGEGFLITAEQAQAWIQEDKKNAEVLKVFSMGRNLADSPDLLSDRWIIDFDDMSLEEASLYTLPFQHVKTHVRPVRTKLNPRNSTNIKRREYWWQPGSNPLKMRQALKELDYCFAVPRVSKWSIFVRFPHRVMLPGDKSLVIASEDYYLLGVLTSKLHRDWVEAQASTLKGDTAYTNTSCFETFPFLWDLSEKQKQSVRDIMKELDEFRLQMMKERDYGITRLYNEFFHEPQSKLTKLHKELDEIVCKIYGWKYDASKNYNEQLYQLNQDLSARE